MKKKSEFFRKTLQRISENSKSEYANVSTSKACSCKISTSASSFYPDGLGQNFDLFSRKFHDFLLKNLNFPILKKSKSNGEGRQKSQIYST
jgi:hypothetical protein